MGMVRRRRMHRSGGQGWTDEGWPSVAPCRIAGMQNGRVGREMVNGKSGGGCRHRGRWLYLFMAAVDVVTVRLVSGTENKTPTGSI
jgi:hypothetical protein